MIFPVDLPWKAIGILGAAALVVSGVLWYGHTRYEAGVGAERATWTAKVEAERERLRAAQEASLQAEAKRALDARLAAPLIESHRNEVNADAQATPDADRIVIPPAIADRLYLDANGNRTRQVRP